MKVYCFSFPNLYLWFLYVKNKMYKLVSIQGEHEMWIWHFIPLPYIYVMTKLLNCAK